VKRGARESITSIGRGRERPPEYYEWCLVEVRSLSLPSCSCRRNFVVLRDLDVIDSRARAQPSDDRPTCTLGSRALVVAARRARAQLLVGLTLAGGSAYRARLLRAVQPRIRRGAAEDARPLALRIHRGVFLTPHRRVCSRLTPSARCSAESLLRLLCSPRQRASVAAASVQTCSFLLGGVRFVPHTAPGQLTFRTLRWVTDWWPSAVRTVRSLDVYVPTLWAQLHAMSDTW